MFGKIVFVISGGFMERRQVDRLLPFDCFLIYDILSNIKTYTIHLINNKPFF